MPTDALIKEIEQSKREILSIVAGKLSPSDVARIEKILSDLIGKVRRGTV